MNSYIAVSPRVTLHLMNPVTRRQRSSRVAVNLSKRGSLQLGTNAQMRWS